MVPFSFNEQSGSLTVVLNNSPVVISTSSRHFDKIKRMLVANSSEKDILATIKKINIDEQTLKQETGGRVTLNASKRVCLDGVELHNAMVTRVYDFI